VQPLSLLLKNSSLVDELALYDVVNTPGVAADLSHISSTAVSKLSIVNQPSESQSLKYTYRKSRATCPKMMAERLL
jgi:malate/lactate dehydrogenase